MITSISPTALKMYEKNPFEFYVRYISPVKLPKEIQGRPAAAGSSFDSFVKYALACHFDLAVHRDHAELFSKQVDVLHREWAYVHGLYIFKAYLNSGAFADLITRIGAAPRMEFRVDGVINGIPMNGRPDLYFRTNIGTANEMDVILDWKLNGYCSRSPISPSPGFVVSRDGWKSGDRKQSKLHGLMHPDCKLTAYKGITVNGDSEALNKDWREQQIIYGWLLGEPIGKEFIVGIDQICSMADFPSGDDPHQVDCYPSLRIASHRSVATTAHQMDLYERLERMWADVSVGCPGLVSQYASQVGGLKSDGTPEGDWFQSVCRPQDKWW